MASALEIRIGFVDNSRELSFSTGQSAQDVRETVEKALEANQTLVEFTDQKNRVFLVRTEAIAYVEIGVGTNRAVGFAGA